MTTEAREIIIVLLQALEESLKQILASQKSSLNDTKEAGSAMTSRYDTFREEAEYRTSAFGLQATSKQEAITRLNRLLQINPATDKKIVSGSIVVILTESEETLVYLPLPEGGGHKFGKNGLTVNNNSPIGKVLMQKEAGDEVALIRSGKIEHCVILEVK